MSHWCLYAFTIIISLHYKSFYALNIQETWKVADSSWAGNPKIPDLEGPNGVGRCAILVNRPKKDVTDDCFQYITKPIPEQLPEGTALVKHHYISMDPTLAIWMQDIPQYMSPVGLNTVMRAGCVGEVIKTSDEEKLPVGTYVGVTGGVAEYSIQKIEMCNPVVPNVPLSWNLGLFSLSLGHTAWIGNKIADPKVGETYVISGAAGAVGSLAGQLGKLNGARVIGIAGGPEKCKYIVDELGFDDAIDYKSEDIKDGLERCAPDGIDCYFDNVGGNILDAVLSRMNTFGRVAFCGAISTYTGGLDDGASVGPTNWKNILMRRLKVQGFICVDHLASVGESFGEIGAALQDGKIKYREDIREATIDEFVEVYNNLYSGRNAGKLILKVHECEGKKDQDFDATNALVADQTNAPTS